jgi:ABC-2 type transport system ATP-binding protein
MIYDTSVSGVTIFVTTHYMDEAEYCERVSIMAEGKIIAMDSPENLKRNNKAKNMEAVFLKLARN